MPTNQDIQKVRGDLKARKDELFDSFKRVLEEAGIENVDLTKIGFSLRPGPKLVCPPGTQPTLEVFENPDGSFEYRVVCK